jgi:hypothetical protein
VIAQNVQIGSPPSAAPTSSDLRQIGGIVRSPWTGADHAG